jgi:hypothetical protein
MVSIFTSPKGQKLNPYVKSTMATCLKIYLAGNGSENYAIHDGGGTIIRGGMTVRYWREGDVLRIANTTIEEGYRVVEDALRILNSMPAVCLEAAEESIEKLNRFANFMRITSGPVGLVLDSPPMWCAALGATARWY